MPAIKVNDLEMHYTERGEGPTVVTLHAATASSLMMGWLAHVVRHEGFNVVTPDLRGHGETPNPAPDVNLPRLVDDILEFIYMLGRTPVHGIGYSLGGAVLLYAARRRTELFSSLILLGTNYHAPPEERLLRVLGPPEQRPEPVRRVFDPETGVTVGWDAPPDSFRGVLCPTLLICGDRDEFNDPEDILTLYRTLPRAETLIVPRTDHLGLVRHPMVLQALQDFYTRVPR
ncbi:MAG TPA: alpha/beta hydrolase [Chloroflexi bacterium]|nr:alpha/beta hydrolase [Chloroflexota bacterium]